MIPTLVNLSDYHIKNINYYWHRKVMYHLTREELAQAGVTSGDAYVEERLVPVLHQVNAQLEHYGFELLIKDGYRSKELYTLV